MSPAGSAQRACSPARSSAFEVVGDGGAPPAARRQAEHVVRRPSCQISTTRWPHQVVWAEGEPTVSAGADEVHLVSARPRREAVVQRGVVVFCCTAPMNP